MCRSIRLPKRVKKRRIWINGNLQSYIRLEHWLLFWMIRSWCGSRIQCCWGRCDRVFKTIRVPIRRLLKIVLRLFLKSPIGIIFYRDVSVLYGARFVTSAGLNTLLCGYCGNKCSWWVYIIQAENLVDIICGSLGVSDSIWWTIGWHHRRLRLFLFRLRAMEKSVKKPCGSHRWKRWCIKQRVLTRLIRLTIFFEDRECQLSCNAEERREKTISARPKKVWGGEKFAVDWKNNRQRSKISTAMVLNGSTLGIGIGKIAAAKVFPFHWLYS